MTTALLQLRDYIARSGKNMTPMFIAPYLSPETRALCREQQCAYLDLEGNARLTLDQSPNRRRTTTTAPLRQ